MVSGVFSERRGNGTGAGGASAKVVGEATGASPAPGGASAGACILDGVAELSWHRADCCFAGCVATCMTYLEEAATYELVMGVSGGAFRLLWHPDWCPSNHDLLVLGREPVARTFDALGYGYELVPRVASGAGATDPADKQLLLGRVLGSLGSGRPLIAHGIVGPEACIIAGYDPATDEMLGRSYFRRGEDYYREANWYAQCWGLILIGSKRLAPSLRRVLCETIQWAIDLARVPWREGRVSGLSAYEAWARALLRDEDFPQGDLRLLTYRCAVSNSATLFGLCEARRLAGAFLRGAGGALPAAARGGCLAAARAYEQEAEILCQAMRMAPSYFDAEEQRLRMADPMRRRAIAQTLMQAREKDAQAVSLLEEIMPQVRQGL